MDEEIKKGASFTKPSENALGQNNTIGCPGVETRGWSLDISGLARCTAPRRVSHRYLCRRDSDWCFVLRSHQNCTGAEVDFADETRASHFGRIPSPKRVRVGRAWVPTTSLLTTEGKFRSRIDVKRRIQNVRSRSHPGASRNLDRRMNIGDRETL